VAFGVPAADAYGAIVARHRIRFRELPVTFDHAEGVRTLRRHHADYFDRLIIAVARIEGLTIVTSDETFRKYDVAILDARY